MCRLPAALMIALTMTAQAVSLESSKSSRISGALTVSVCQESTLGEIRRLDCWAADGIDATNNNVLRSHTVTLGNGKNLAASVVQLDESSCNGLYRQLRTGFGK